MRLNGPSNDNKYMQNTSTAFPDFISRDFTIILELLYFVDEETEMLNGVMRLHGEKSRAFLPTQFTKE